MLGKHVEQGEYRRGAGKIGGKILLFEEIDHHVLVLVLTMITVVMVWHALSLDRQCFRDSWGSPPRGGPSLKYAR